MSPLARHELTPRGHLGHQPPPRSWDYLDRHPNGTARPFFEHDIALVTCSEGHTCRLVDTVHRVAADGAVSPSLVCPIPGCSFHEFVRLVGWDAKEPRP